MGASGIAYRAWGVGLRASHVLCSAAMDGPVLGESSLDGALMSLGIA